MHLVWDWNGTLLDDLNLVVEATNASLAATGGPSVTAAEHRRDFRRPISHYYEGVLGRPIDEAEFAVLDKEFHRAYNAGLPGCGLSAGAREAIAGWPGTQSLLSMWFHVDLVPAVTRLGLIGHFVRVDGLRAATGGGFKHPHLVEHLAGLGVAGPDCVLIGDSVDDAEAACSVGASVVLYSGGFTDPANLRATGHPVADTLSGAVAQAMALAGAR